MRLKACGLASPSFIVSSQNAAVSKTQSLSNKCSAIGTGLPLRKFEQPSYLLNVIPGMYAADVCNADSPYMTFAPQCCARNSLILIT
eukprot:363913-Chlamydomonas_euryale.AAC.14